MSSQHIIDGERGTVSLQHKQHNIAHMGKRLCSKKDTKI